MKQLLIAEDDERTRRTIRTICSQSPAAAAFSIHEAANGLEAYEFIVEAAPQLVFLDMEMPGMTGAELLERLAAEKVYVSIVVISGYGDYHYTHEAIRYGIIDYLLKPINRQQLLAVLGRFALEGDEEVQRRRQRFGQLAAAELDGLPPTMIDEVKDYIDNNLDRHLTLTDVAEHFHYSGEHISREFKRRFGIGFARYANDMRLERARQYLMSGCLVHEAASRAGFVDDSYFARLFREKYGLSPKKFLASLR